MFLLARSETHLIAGRVIRRATRWSVLFGDAALSFWSGVGAAVTCSASVAAAATCCCIVLALEPAAASPADSSRAFAGGDESGIRKIVKPALSGSQSAASG